MPLTIKWSQPIWASTRILIQDSHHHRPLARDHHMFTIHYEPPLVKKSSKHIPGQDHHTKPCNTHHKSPLPLHYRLVQPNHRQAKFCCRVLGGHPSPPGATRFKTHCLLAIAWWINPHRQALCALGTPCFMAIAWRSSPHRQALH